MAAENHYLVLDHTDNTGEKIAHSIMASPRVLVTSDEALSNFMYLYLEGDAAGSAAVPILKGQKMTGFLQLENPIFSIVFGRDQAIKTFCMKLGFYIGTYYTVIYPSNIQIREVLGHKTGTKLIKVLKYIREFNPYRNSAENYFALPHIDQALAALTISGLELAKCYNDGALFASQEDAPFKHLMQLKVKDGKKVEPVFSHAAREEIDAEKRKQAASAPKTLAIPVWSPPISGLGMPPAPAPAYTAPPAVRPALAGTPAGTLNLEPLFALITEWADKALEAAKHCESEVNFLEWYSNREPDITNYEKIAEWPEKKSEGLPYPPTSFVARFFDELSSLWLSSPERYKDEAVRQIYIFTREVFTNRLNTFRKTNGVPTHPAFAIHFSLPLWLLPDKKTSEDPELATTSSQAPTGPHVFLPPPLGASKAGPPPADTSDTSGMMAALIH